MGQQVKGSILCMALQGDLLKVTSKEHGSSGHELTE